MVAQENQIYIAIILAVFVFGFAISYFFYSLLRQHKKLRDIERGNASAQIEALEKDRARIASDLHDELSPMLAAVRMKINSFDLIKPEDQKNLERTNSHIDDIARQMRAISFDLMPTTLQEKGLQTAVREFASYISRTSNFHIKFSGLDEPLLLDQQKTIHSYRIIQEIIHNTLKHAQATELTIVLALEKKYFVIATRDNGRGFNYDEQLKKSKGLGLRSLMNRIYLLQAEFLIESKENLGTCITIRIPTEQ